MFVGSENSGLRSSVTTVKKNVPPGRNDRRYSIGSD
jgi:hypothetical protein